MLYYAGRTLTSKIAYYARNSAGRIYPSLNAGQHAISRQKRTGFSTRLYPVYNVYWEPCGTDGRTDGRTDGHVTITSLPKFLGLIGYQISLAMELR